MRAFAEEQRSRNTLRVGVEVAWVLECALGSGTLRGSLELLMAARHFAVSSVMCDHRRTGQRGEYDVSGLACFRPARLSSI